MNKWQDEVVLLPYPSGIDVDLLTESIADYDDAFGYGSAECLYLKDGLLVRKEFMKDYQKLMDQIVRDINEDDE